MIRTNIHFDKSALKRLDEIAADIRKQDKYNYYTANTTRANLIRLAVVEFYEVGDIPGLHHREHLLTILKKIKALKIKVK